MYSPELFHNRSRPTQIVVAGLVPAAIGALAGILIGASAVAYWVVAILAAVGAFLAGFEHVGRRDCALRGLVGGLIYGVALLAVHAIVGTHAKVSLGSAPPLLAVLTAAISLVLALAGGRVGAARRAGAPDGDLAEAIGRDGEG